MRVEFIEIKKVRLTEYYGVYMKCTFVNDNARSYRLIVNGTTSKEYRYHLWRLQNKRLFFRLSNGINTFLAKRRIKKLGGKKR